MACREKRLLCLRPVKCIVIGLVCIFLNMHISLTQFNHWHIEPANMKSFNVLEIVGNKQWTDRPASMKSFEDLGIVGNKQWTNTPESMKSIDESLGGNKHWGTFNDSINNKDGEFDLKMCIEQNKALIDEIDSYNGYTNSVPDIFNSWIAKKVSFCNKNDSAFIAYAHEFASLNSVIVDPSHFHGQKGGQDLEKVMMQTESVEYYKYNIGCFQVNCQVDTAVASAYKFLKNNNHLNGYLNAVNASRILYNPKMPEIGSNLILENQKMTESGSMLLENQKMTESRSSLLENQKMSSQKTMIKSESPLTIVVTRYEYVNLYHTMTDWYNAYLMMRFFHISAAETNILIIDAHPKGSLDETWRVLFNSSTRMTDMSVKTVFPFMVWSILGYTSPMSVSSRTKELPFVEEYRNFFLTQHCVSPFYQLSCDRLNILIIWRHDYVAHPRNPNGMVKRKIANEEEILNYFKEKYPNYNISGLQLDDRSMRDQLLYTSKTDIFIGVHGAGLTHSMFLPKHASLIELYPKYAPLSNTHFRQIAKWRGLYYQSWKNDNSRYEIGSTYSTIFKPAVIDNMVVEAVKYMKCQI